MRLFYIENLRLPTEKAHGVQIMKMCEALAVEGIDLILFLPQKFTPIKEPPFEYYNVQKNFKIKKIFSLNLIYFEKILKGFGFWLENVIYTLIVLIWSAFQKKPDVIYTRQVFIAFIFSLFYKKVYFEAHVFKKNKFYQWLLKPVSGIIVITKTLEELHEEILPNKRILVAYDGVDLEKFNCDINRPEARKRLGLNLEERLIVYLGSLFNWKGAHILAQAADYLTNEYQLYFVGGTEEDVKIFKKKYNKKNLHLVGHKPYQEVPLWLKAADLLIIPNSGKYEISRFYTSPMKLFEYLASKTPIIASDLPSLREVLDESCCQFFQPDNPKDLADRIKEFFANKKIGENLSSQGFNKVVRYSWKNRARLIINFIK